MTKGKNSFRISYGYDDSDLLYLLVTVFSHLHLSINLTVVTSSIKIFDNLYY